MNFKVGTGIITVPPTTTTTVCARPSNLNELIFGEGYQIVGDSPQLTTGSKDDACGAANFIMANPAVALAILTSKQM